MYYQLSDYYGDILCEQSCMGPISQTHTPKARYRTGLFSKYYLHLTQLINASAATWSNTSFGGFNAMVDHSQRGYPLGSSTVTNKASWERLWV